MRYRRGFGIIPALSQTPKGTRKFVVRTRLTSPGMYQTVKRNLGYDPPSEYIASDRSGLDNAVVYIGEKAEKFAKLTGEHYSVEVEPASHRGTRCDAQVDSHGHWFKWQCFKVRW